MPTLKSQLITRYILYGRVALVVSVIWLLVITLTVMSVLTGFARRLLVLLLMT
jgi:hypothetical protein